MEIHQTASRNHIAKIDHAADKSQTQQQKDEVAALAAHHLPLLLINKGQSRQGQAQKERGQEINMRLKELRQYQHRCCHADDPAHAKLAEIAQPLPAFTPRTVEKKMQRVNKAFVKSENIGNRAAADARHAIGQCHAKAVKDIVNHQFPSLSKGRYSHTLYYTLSAPALATSAGHPYLALKR